MSRLLGISLLHIETAFDLYKGKSGTQALLEYRLNRLSDLIGRYPSQDIREQIRRCGLSPELSSGVASFAETNEQFSECFGIGLIEYHQQCYLANTERLRRQQSTASNDKDELVGASTRINLLLTRFRHPEST